jgi:Spy/CpxP family protein refolding chaperone
VKKSIAVTALAVIAGVVSLSWAANTSPTPTSPSANTPLHQMGVKFREDMIQIQKDVKSGKLTQAQATEYREQLKAIRKQEMADVKANGTKTLTTDQESGLMSQLEVVEKSI